MKRPTWEAIERLRGRSDTEHLKWCYRLTVAVSVVGKSDPRVVRITKSDAGYVLFFPDKPPVDMPLGRFFAMARKHGYRHTQADRYLRSSPRRVSSKPAPSGGEVGAP